MCVCVCVSVCVCVGVVFCDLYMTDKHLRLKAGFVANERDETLRHAS